MIDLSGARTKLDRAQQQLHSLGHTLMAYAEREPYQLIERFDLNADDEVGTYRYIVTDLRPTRPVFAVHMGEIVHNFRSALDYLAYAAARRPSYATQFPIVYRASDWVPKALPMLRSVPRRFVRAIEESQPYHLPTPSEHILAVLNHLSNTDKHRLLHTTQTALSEAAPGFHPDRDVAAILEVDLHTGVLEEGTELVRLTLEPSGPFPSVTMTGEFRLSVAFRDSTPSGRAIDGKSVLHVLFGIGRYLERLYERFEEEGAKGDPSSGR